MAFVMKDSSGTGSSGPTHGELFGGIVGHEGDSINKGN